jgi:hypothetical protein
LGAGLRPSRLLASPQTWGSMCSSPFSIVYCHASFNSVSLHCSFCLFHHFKNLKRFSLSSFCILILTNRNLKNPKRFPLSSFCILLSFQTKTSKTKKISSASFECLLHFFYNFKTSKTQKYVRFASKREKGVVDFCMLVFTV